MNIQSWLLLAVVAAVFLYVLRHIFRDGGGKDCDGSCGGCNCCNR